MRTRALLALVPIVAALFAARSASAAGPQILETWVTGVTATSASLRARLEPQGLSTSYRFEYVTEAAYEAGGFTAASFAPPSGAALVGGGNTTIAVSQLVGSLAPETSYRYRVRATSSAGTEYGETRLLTTSAPTNAFPSIDGRGYELVSPVDKDGGAVGAPESIFGGGVFQAGAGGGSLTFSSTSSFGEAAAAPPASQYVSTRDGSGWVVRNVSGPLEAGGYGDRPDGVPYRLFSADLSRALMLDGLRCTAQGTCPPTYSLWDGASFFALPTAPGLRLAGATADLGHVVFEAQGGLYEWSGGGLEAVSAEPGAALAAPIGAISEDGSRVYWVGSAGGLHLDEAGTDRPVDESGQAEFQVASADGAAAFYLKENTLFRFSAATGTSAAIAAEVSGVLGVSAAGDVAYFQDAGGLERWREGTVSTLAPGSVASTSDYPPATATARVSRDGEHLAFLSAAAIPPFDNTDANTGLPDTELYLYGPPPGGGPPRLLCASCNPTGERPGGSASIPGLVRNGSSALYRPRVLSAGGGRVFFETADRLVVPDTDGRPDVYEWEAAGVGDCTRSLGCTGLISGGRGEGGRFLDASESGDDVFFLTGDSLLGADPGSIDAYDDRAGGGIPEPEPPFLCKGDACQALPSPPEDPSPATLVPTAGNPPAKVEKLKERRRCPKGKVRRNGFCLRSLHHHRHKARHHHAKKRVDR